MFKVTKLVFIFLVALLIFLLALNIKKIQGRVDSLHNSLIGFYRVLSIPVYFAKEKYYKFAEYINTIKQSKELLLENQNLKLKLNQLNLLEQEILELKEILNFKSNSNFASITTTILIQPGQSFNKQYLLDIGKNSGIRSGNSVLSQGNLIGRVINVSENFSKVQLLSDPNFKVSVHIIGTYYYGIAYGIYDTDYMKIMYLPDDIEIEEGQTVVTSGECGLIPYGVYIGKITKINGDIFLQLNKRKIKRFVEIIKS